MLVFCHSLPTSASEQEPNQANKLELLQTDITQNDLKIIEQLATIAENNSSEVMEAKSATGWRAFQNVVSIEVSPSMTTSYNSPDDSEEKESSFYLSITLDPIKLISAFDEKRIFQARLHEAKQQKRLAVIRYYLAYLQAHQAVKIAAYRMKNSINDERIASINLQSKPYESPNSIANPNYVTIATEMLNSNAKEQVALEELAACVGLSTSTILNIINGR